MTTHGTITAYRSGCRCLLCQLGQRRVSREKSRRMRDRRRDDIPLDGYCPICDEFVDRLIHHEATTHRSAS